MRNPWMILPCWFFVYVMYRGKCVTIYEFFGWVLETFGGTVEDGVELPSTFTSKRAGQIHGAIGAACTNTKRY
jgi:hypothetical protein